MTYLNPFAAIKSVCDEMNRPDLYAVALRELAKAAEWEDLGASMFDDLLQEIAGSTHIVVHYHAGGLFTAHYEGATQ